MSMEENDFENAAKKLMESEKAVSDAKAEVEAESEKAAAEAKAAGEAAAAEAKAASDAATAEAEAATEVTSEGTAAEMKSEADTIVENAVVNAEAKAEAAEAAINDDTVVLDADAIVDEKVVEPAAEADGGEEVAKPELRRDDTTQTTEVDNISPDGSASNVDAGSVDNTASVGFDADNPQYEEHRYNYDEPVHPGYGAAYAQSQAATTKGFISKKAFYLQYNK